MNPPIITVSVFDSLRRGDFSFYRRIVPDTYNHTISATVGYDTAQLTITGSRTDAEDWLEQGLGRHVEVYGSALDLIWEGFVNEVRANVAPLTITLGPLLDAANRVYVLYTPVESTQLGEAAGGQEITTAQDNTDSQTRYGILPKVISAGTMSISDSTYIRDTYIAANAWPKATESVSSSASRGVSITLTCRGYYHWLGYPYNVAHPWPYINASTRIANVLADNPNDSWLPFNTDNIQTNSLNVYFGEDQYRPASTVIKEMVAKGDTSNARWLFQILDDREAHYYPAPTDVEYMAYVEDRGLVIRSAAQAQIQPWRIRPGRWLSFVDFMVGRSIPAPATNADPRLMFIEKVTYRAPFGLQLQGGNTDEIYQVLAKWGMGAM